MIATSRIPRSTRRNILPPDLRLSTNCSAGLPAGRRHQPQRHVRLRQAHAHCSAARDLAKAGAQTLFTGVTPGSGRRRPGRADRPERLGQVADPLAHPPGLNRPTAAPSPYRTRARTAYLAQGGRCSTTRPVASTTCSPRTRTWTWTKPSGYSRVSVLEAGPLRRSAPAGGVELGGAQLAVPGPGRPVAWPTAAADEPTNHLDIEGILAGSSWPAVGRRPWHARGMADRRFLENTVTCTGDRAWRRFTPTARSRCGLRRLPRKKADSSRRSDRTERLANWPRREIECCCRGPARLATSVCYRIEEAGRPQRLHRATATRCRRPGGIPVSTVPPENEELLLPPPARPRPRGGRAAVHRSRPDRGPGTGSAWLGQQRQVHLMQISPRPATGGLCARSATITLADQVRIVSFDQRANS